jgi:hypothetical protein
MIWQIIFREETILGHRPSLGIKQTCQWIRKMEVVDCWKPESCCEISARFYGGGSLETNSVHNAFPCKRTSN